MQVPTDVCECGVVCVGYAKRPPEGEAIARLKLPEKGLCGWVRWASERLSPWPGDGETWPGETWPGDMAGQRKEKERV